VWRKREIGEKNGIRKKRAGRVRGGTWKRFNGKERIRLATGGGVNRLRLYPKMSDGTRIFEEQSKEVKKKHRGVVREN